MILARNCCAHHSSRSMGTKSVGRVEGWAVMLPPRSVSVCPFELTTSPSPRPKCSKHWEEAGQVQAPSPIP